MVFERFKQDDLRGVRFALNVFIGATALWLLLRHAAGVNPIWSIASMVAASEPTMGDALRMSRASLINTAVGCAVGFAVLVTGGSSEWKKACSPAYSSTTGPATSASSKTPSNEP